MDHLATYASWDLDDIAIVGGSFSETPSGHVEYDTEDVVCRRGGKPLRMRVVWTKNYFKSSERSRIDEEHAISNEEYQALAEGKTIADGAALRRKVARRHQLQAARRALIPNCAKCGAPMVERSGKKGIFWGCSAWRPEGGCTSTRDLTSTERQQLKAIDDEISSG